MRFGTRSHDTIDTDQRDAKLASERERLVALLRGIANQIEAAPDERLSVGLAWIMNAVEPLTRVVERALGRR
jgi:hypothetical protein